VDARDGKGHGQRGVQRLGEADVSVKGREKVRLKQPDVAL
jgi:hypothetical protein